MIITKIFCETELLTENLYIEEKMLFITYVYKNIYLWLYPLMIFEELRVSSPFKNMIFKKIMIHFESYN